MSTISLKEYLRGLRKDGESSVGLVTCTGYDVGETRLLPNRTVALPILDVTLTAASITKSFPWPQFIVTEKYTLVAIATKLYTWSVSGGTITEIQTYDALAPASTATIPSGALWKVADFGSTVLLSNGACILTFGCEPASTKWLVWDEHYPGSALRVGSRLLCSNLSHAAIGDSVATQSWYSGFDQSDITCWGLNVTDEEYSLKAEAGFINHDSTGTFTASASLGEYALLGGVKGSILLSPVDSPSGPFAITELPFGVKANCVSAYLGGFIALDTASDLWVIALDGKYERLGYSEFLSTLSNPILYFDSINEELYLLGSGASYKFTKWGLNKLLAIYTTVNNYGASIVGCQLSTTTSRSLGAYLRSTPFLTLLDISVLGYMPQATIAVVSAYTASGVAMGSRTVTLDMLGKAPLNLAGEEFRVAITTGVAASFVEDLVLTTTNRGGI